VHEQNEGRYAADAVARRQRRLFLGVDLEEPVVRFELGGGALVSRRLARQGPHQGAQKSTITGMSLRVMWRSKVSASALAGFPENSFWWQVPHLAWRAGGSGGVRLIALQCGHTT
jgi:hypothetical protein